MVTITTRRVLSFLSILSLLTIRCDKATQTLAILPAEKLASEVPVGVDSGWYSLYFTDPTRPAAEIYSNSPDKALAQAIDRARMSVDVAIYDLNLYSFSNALIRAHRRGVKVRVVTESDNMDNVETMIPALKEAGIAVIGDRREGSMHNKFTVIDRVEVWGGSMNYSYNDAYRSDNNLICIRSTEVAEIYTTEFNEMFEEDRFGPEIGSITPYPKVSINGTEIEVYFSPDDGVMTHIVDLVNGAQESIYFLAYSFTADKIANAMLARSEMGITLAGVFDKNQVTSNPNSSEFDSMCAAGLDVWLDANPMNMHNKLILIDQKIVITGSYNFSTAAEEKNDENILILHNADIAGLYYQDFQRIYALARK